MFEMITHNGSYEKAVYKFTGLNTDPGTTFSLVDSDSFEFIKEMSTVRDALWTGSLGDGNGFSSFDAAVASECPALWGGSAGW